MHSDAFHTPELSGMSVTERLQALGLLNEFDSLVVRRERAKLVALLKRVELSERDAVVCTDAVLADPKRFGY